MGFTNAKQLLTQYEQLKKKHENTNEFKEFEKHYGFEIEFLKFKLENKLHYNTNKRKWNKPFINTVKSVWITTPKKNWNRKERKYGYWQNIHTGWQLLQNEADYKCRWCGKLLPLSKQKFCNSTHRKLFSKVINEGKKRHGFDLTKDNHILIKPKLYNYEITKSGAYVETQSGKNKIEFKDIEFSINGYRYPYTKKSRTI